MKIPFFDEKHRQQELLIFTGDGKIVHDSLRVDRGYCLDSQHEEGYFNVKQGLLRDNKSGASCLVVSELTGIPLFLSVAIDRSAMVKGLIERMGLIAEDNLEKALAHIVAKEAKDRIAQMLMITVLALVVLVVVMIIAALFASGKVQMPW